MTHRYRRSGTGPEVIGIVLIVVGGLFLLQNVGLFRLAWGAFWPLLVVVVGVVILVSALRPRTAAPSTVTVPVDGADRLELALRFGAGRVRVAGDAPTGTLVAAHSLDDDVASTVQRDGSLARVRLSREVGDWFPLSWSRPGAEWTIGLAPTVPTRLDLSAGAGELTFDLLGVAVADARMSVGAAQLNVRLPRPVGEVPVRITAGAASVVLEVPAGVEARVITSGLMSVDGRNETPGYGTAHDRVTVTVEGGASSVRIR